MTQHTPGPWGADLRDPDYPEIYETATGSNFLVATVERCWKNHGSADVDRDLPRQKANADLIAAAPEMLDVLRRVLKDIPWGGLGCGEIADAVAMAIANAEGRGDTGRYFWIDERHSAYGSGSEGR